MTTLTIDIKHADILQSFGNLEEIVEEAVHNYAIKRINERIENARQEVLSFEAKYGMTYEEFHAGITGDLEFLKNLRKDHPIWERDFNVWEYYVEELTEWLNRLKTISKS